MERRSVRAGSTPAEGDDGKGDSGPAHLRLAVAETPPGMRADDEGWRRLAAAVREATPDLLLLAEMPFGPWLAGRDRFDPEAAGVACRLHEEGIGRLGELGASRVLASRPRLAGERLVNEAFCWMAPSADGPGARADALLPPVHTKQHFPAEPGYWETAWFRPGSERFGLAALPVGGPASEAGVPVDRLRVGFLLCTDAWFPERARAYGRRGAGLVAVPRVTPPETIDRWRTAVRMAALLAGAYAASAGRAGIDDRGQAFGGRGWIFSPEGDLLAETSPKAPLAVADLDLALPVRARETYPRYVR